MIPTAFWAVLAGLAGLAVGSFLNVVIHRVPAGLSIVRPPSACPRCGNPIRNRHNVPVLGWLVLRGRCADCGEPISARYPLVEATTGLLFAAVTAGLLGQHRAAALAAYLVLVAGGVTLVMIDVDHRRLPRTVLLPTAGAVAALLVVASAVSDDWAALARGVLGATVTAAVVGGAAVTPRSRVRAGEVELAALTGVGLGYLSWAALAAGVVLSGAAALSGTAVRRATTG